ncbi:MAG: beta-phosphoglucomutase [Alphaproteobacteria bacterium]
MVAIKRSLKVDNWSIIEDNYDAERKNQHASLFFVGNGNLGLPGGFSEDGNTPLYVNGFFESSPYTYGEKAYGYPENKQTMLPLASPIIFHLEVDGERLDLNIIEFSQYERILHFKDAILKRSFIWHLTNGKKVTVEFEHLLSFSYLNSGFASLIVTPHDDAEVQIQVISALHMNNIIKQHDHDPRKAEAFNHNIWHTKKSEVDGEKGLFSQNTTNSNMHFAAAIGHKCSAPSFSESQAKDTGLYFTFNATTAEPYEVTKFFSYTTNIEAEINNLEDEAQTALNNIEQLGKHLLIKVQESYLDSFWQDADIELNGNDALQQGLRYNAFALLQSAGHDGKRSIAAKGLSSDGYEGHYFWDADSYVVPHFIYSQPEIAKAMLTYRYNTLDNARARAQLLSHKGALYPWRTINGEECSAFFPAGTAQYHINADIALAIKQYVQTTGDTQFLEDIGKEILFEIARFFMSLGYFNRKGKFVINGVTGPDEYTAIVNNNMYTNIMVKDSLKYVASLKDDDEAKLWQKASDAMYIPYCDELAIHKQDDSFLDKEVWDFQNTPKENYPLLLHYHPLNIYRYQVLKQPDAVLANLFQGQYFTYADKRRNFYYYDGLCTGDSSLAPSVQSIMASELNMPELALSYFNQTARMDLDDLHDNVGNGIHTACMAGTWLAVIQGFGGFRNIDGTYHFAPNLPKPWQSLSFKLKLSGCMLQIVMNKQETVYTLVEGISLTLTHYGEEIILSNNQPIAKPTAFELKAVIFDLDGVVTDTAELHYQAWKQMSDNMGLNFDREVNENLRGVTRRRSLETILEHNNTSLPDDEIERLMEEKNNIYTELLNDISPKDILPGIAQFLKDLKDADIHAALASASRNAPRILEQLGLTEYFALIVDVPSLKKNKPDPEIFLSAAEQLGVHYKNCVGVEDAAAGIDAITLAGGMMSVGIGDAAKEGYWTIADTSLLNLADLRVEFKKYQQN